MVGSAGDTLEVWGAARAVIAHSTTAPIDDAETAAVDRELAWQSTFGQIIFLQSVVRTPP